MNTTTLNMTTLDGGNVIIKKGGGGTPTPPSGGVRSSWRYFDVSKAVEGLSVRAVFPTLVRVYGSAEILSAVTLEEERWNSVTAFGVDGDGILVAYDGVPYTWNEGMALEGFTPENLPQFGITEITEDEFLNKTFE